MRSRWVFIPCRRWCTTPSVTVSTCGRRVSRRAIGSARRRRRAIRCDRRCGSGGGSSSASGVYLKGLFQRLGLADALGDRIRQVEGEPVGSVVARGEAEIGFQQVSELLPVPGIDYVGPLPSEIQQFTVFSAGIASATREPDAARALIAYLTAPAAIPLVRQSGIEPA